MLRKTSSVVREEGRKVGRAGDVLVLMVSYTLSPNLGSETEKELDGREAAHFEQQ